MFFASEAYAMAKEFNYSSSPQTVYNELILEDKELKHQLNIMAHNGIQNLFYLASKGAIGNDHEGTVDGVHCTDLGFSRYAEYLINYFKKLELIDK